MLLPQLSSVTLLHRNALGGSNTPHLLHCVPHLAQLQLRSAGDAAQLVEAVSSSRLTSLEVSGYCYPRVFAPSLPRNAPQLAQLQKLALRDANIYPGVLASMPQLSWLELHDCTWLSTQVVGNFQQHGATDLLDAVRLLQQLQHLSVRCGDGGTSLEAASFQKFSALTASPHITHLELSLFAEEDGRLLLPVGAFQHIFPAGKQFPQLQEVTISGLCYTDTKPFMSAADLKCITSACPGLHSLDITAALRNDGVTALLELPRTCSSLVLGGEAMGDDAIPVLLQLTQLTSLAWEGSFYLTDSGLDQLTVLTGLQRLYLHDLNGLTAEVAGKSDVKDCMQDPVELTAKSDAQVRTRCALV